MQAANVEVANTLLSFLPKDLFESDQSGEQDDSGFSFADDSTLTCSIVSGDRFAAYLTLARQDMHSVSGNKMRRRAIESEELTKSFRPTATSLPCKTILHPSKNAGTERHYVQGLVGIKNMLASTISEKCFSSDVELSDQR